METLKLLATALSLATLAGINLYLTVFVTGMAIRFEWIILPSNLQQLEVLAHPVILVVSGVLYLIEFFADKIPWVDSLWDSVHTFIRPIGGTMLAITALGQTNPVYDVVVGILAAGMSLTAHGTKASVRVIANGSPEPFSNIALSVAEDVGVLTMLGLLAWNPFAAIGVLIVLLGGAVWLLPRLLRTVRVFAWFAWRKLQLPASVSVAASLPKRIPSDYDVLLHRLQPGPTTIRYAAPVVSGGGKRVPTHVDGWVVATEEKPAQIFFLAKRALGSLTQVIELTGMEVSHEPRFLSESVILYDRAGSRRLRFLFDRQSGAVAEALARSIRGQIDDLHPSIESPLLEVAGTATDRAPERLQP